MKNLMTPSRKLSIHKKLLVAAYPLIIVLCAVGVIFAAISGSRKLDYVITDGNDIIKVSSYSQSAESVLNELDIDTQGATYEIVSCDGYTEIIITRTFPVTVIHGDITTTTKVADGTVSSLLHDLGIVLDSNDILSCELTDELYSGMAIKVTRVDVEYSTVETAIPYDTKYVDSPYLAAGTEKVVMTGSDGVLMTTYKSTYFDGVLDSFSIESQSVATEPVTAIVATGTNGKAQTEAADTQRSAEALTYKTDASNDDPQVTENTVTTLSGETLSYSKVLKMTATAYTYNSGKNITSSGVPAQVGVVAALPSTLPQGTHVYIVSADGTWEYGVAIVGDRPAHNIVDLFMETYDECIQFGVRNALVYVLD